MKILLSLLQHCTWPLIIWLVIKRQTQNNTFITMVLSVSVLFFSLSPFLSLSALVKLSCPVAVPLWPPVCDWCFYWCPTDSGVMRLLQRSQRSIMLPPRPLPTPTTAWQHSSGCVSQQHLETMSVLVPLPCSGTKMTSLPEISFKKKCAQEISHPPVTPPPSSPPSGTI